MHFGLHTCTGILYIGVWNGLTPRRRQRASCIQFLAMPCVGESTAAQNAFAVPTKVKYQNLMNFLYPGLWYSHEFSLSLLSATFVMLIPLANSLDPDHDRLSVGPDLDTNRLTF